MIAIKETLESDDIVIVTSKGMIIRQHVKDVNVLGRNTQGVRLIRLEEGDTVADVAVVPAESEEEAENLIEKLEAEKGSDEKPEPKKVAGMESAGKNGEPAKRSKNSEKKNKRK